MARALPKKSRTPPPPKRPVQSPKQRTAPRDERRARLLLYALGGSGFVILAIVAAALIFAGGSGGESTQNAVAALREAGCTYTQPKSQGRQHVNALSATFKPNSVPRSSGPHSNQTIIFGSYSEMVPELNAVHNLEHGAVIIWYGRDVPESTVEQINDFYNKDPNGLIVSQYPQLGDEIALVSWTHVARCPGWDENAAEQFVDSFGFRGPESCKSDIEQGCFRRENLKAGEP